MKDIQSWLEAQGLGKYADTFVENDIGLDVLPDLDRADLKDLGVSLGDGKRLLKAALTLSERSDHPAVGSASKSMGSNVSSPVDAERRQLTVMFCDLAGSTRLSEELDLETYRDVLSAYQNAARHAIAPYDGYIARYMGDGLLVYFGYPQAHEDDAERAVRAGLEIVANVQGLVEKELAVRIGIATGQVVAGDIVGEGASEELAVLGETPNLAARLQSAAEPNSVVVSESTKRLVEGRISLKPLGSRALKGISRQVPIFLANEVHGQASRFEAAHDGNLGPLSGRDSELALLLQRWGQARSGEGQVVFIEGEPGIGKSRLIQALRDKVVDTAYVVQRYQCSPYYTSTPFYPAIDLMGRAAGLTREDGVEERLEKLNATVTKLLPSDSHAPALVAALHSLPTDRSSLLEMTPQKQRLETIQMLVNQFEALARQGTVLTLFEDVHWCDPSTLDLLGAVIDRVQHLPVLMVVTHRPEFVPSWTGYGHTTTYSLNRLGREAVGRVIDNVTDGKSLPKEVTDQIVAKTDGVPLFIEELTKTVVESGLLKDGGDHWLLEGVLPPLAIPSTLQDSLVSRLDRLSSAKEIAQIGGCIGREFHYELLADVSPLTEPKLREGLELLEGNGLVFRRGEVPDATYIFKHALVQDAARSTLLPSRLQQVHLQIATAIQQRYPEIEEAQPELLAFHYSEAGSENFQAAIGLWKYAGESALYRSANVEAVSHLSRALELLEARPRGLPRDQLELELLISLGSARMAADGLAAPRVGETYLRARELCDSMGQVPEVFPALWGLWMYTSVRSEHVDALSIGEQLLVLAQELGQSKEGTISLVAAHRAVATSSLFLGHPQTAHEHFECAVRNYDIDVHRSMVSRYGLDLGATSLFADSWALWLLGLADSALERIQQAHDLVRELNHPHSLAWTLVWHGLLHVYRREPGLAAPIADQLRVLSLEHQFPQTLGLARIVDGWAKAAAGDGDEGAQRIEEGISGWTGTGARQMVPTWKTFLAQAYGQAGRVDNALEEIDAALMEVESCNHRMYEAEIHRVRGDLLSRTDPTEAESCYRQAIQIAERQCSRAFVLRASTDLARVLHLTQPEEACALLRSACGSFTEGFNTVDFRAAQSLLASCT